MSGERAEVSVRFGRFVLDGGLRELRRDGRRIALQPTPMRLLWYLIHNRDRVVPGMELLERVWPEVHVTDLALAGAIRTLRRVLGDEGRSLIQTRRGHGYRFSADVEELGAGTSPPATRDASSGLAGPGLLGRASEVAQLESALAACVEGRGQVVLVRGMVGIGKTSLAEHLKATARDRGLGVHAAAWYAGGGAPPLAPWIQFLEDCLGDMGDPERHPAGAWLRSGGLVREMWGGDGDSTSRGAARPPFAMSRIVIDVLGEAARRRPRVLVLEDLHEADLDSLVVLELVVGSLSELPVLLLTTLRQETGAPGAALRRTLVALRRAPGYSEHPLGGLDRDSVRSLLASGSAPPPPESFVARVLELTGGNPLFVTELARLRASGRLQADDGSAIALPEAARDALEMQIAQHRPGCQRALRVASVAGGEFGLELLCRLLDASRGHVLDVLSEAEAGGLVCEAAGRPGTYAFPHPLMREVLYAGLTRTEARRWHLRTAEVLEALHASDLSSCLSRLAYHFFEAAPVGGAERAVEYGRRAAEQSHRLWAFSDAAEHYRRSLQALEHVADPDPHLKSELHMAYGRELQISPLREHRPGEARTSFEAALRIAAQARSPERLAAALVDQIRVELEPLLIAGRSTQVPPPALQRLRSQVTDALESLLGESSLARGRLLVCMAYMHFFAGERSALDRCLQEAEVDAEEEARHPQLLEELLVARWWFAQAPDALAERHRLGERLRAITGRARWLVFALAEAGDLAAADEAMREATRSVRGESPDDPEHYLWHIMRATLSGRFADAERLLQELDRFDSFMARSACSVQRLWLRRLQGRAAEVLPAPREGQSAFGRLFRALYCADVGRIDQAREELRASELDRIEEVLPLNQGWLFTLSLAADVMHQAREAAQAKHLYERLLPFEGRMIGSMWMLMFVGSVDRPLGLLAACDHAWDTAVDHLECALLAHERLDASALVAQSQLDLASTLHRRRLAGDSRRAETLARAAATTATELGMLRVAEQARELLGGASLRS